MLTFTLLPQRTLGHGPPEERATFGTLVVRANERCLTEGVAQDANDLSLGPNVSGYHIAEWLLWNVWRLRWEARPDSSGGDWAFSHCLASIGQGYVWPNIEISSDGVRAILTSLPTIDPASGLYRYVGTPAAEVVAASELEDAVRDFAKNVLRLLDRAKVLDTNLHSLWHDVERERQDPEAARLRRLEARLGHDPDEIHADDVRVAAEAGRDFGADSVEELVAEAGWHGVTTLPSVEELATTARRVGSELCAQDAVTLRADDDMPAWGDVAAWRVGVTTARLLRRQEALEGQPIGNDRLAGLAGVATTTLDEHDAQQSSLSFVLAAGDRAQVALRSKRRTSRRFDLARLLGDRLFGHDEPLTPATRARTYRQKAQRAFAAELLCPYEAVCDFLRNDRSEDRHDDAASHFGVSPLAVDTILRNNERSPHNPPVVW